MATSKTVKASGGDYTTLSAWEDAIDGDLTGTGVAEVTCYAIDDTTAVSIAGWTTTSSDYVYIHVDSTARHAGKWDGDKYNLVLADVDAFTIGEDFVRVDGLQVCTSSMNGNGDDPISIPNGAIGASGDIRLSNIIVKGSADTTYYQYGIGVSDADAVVKIWNSIVYNVGGSASVNSIGLVSVGTTSLYSSTVIGGRYGIACNGGTLTVKNTYAGGSVTEDYIRVSGTLAKTNCASEDQSADDTGTNETASNCVAAAVALSTSTFVNVTAGSEDYHLVVGSALIGAGASTSGESAPLDFTIDIDGDTRS